MSHHMLQSCNPMLLMSEVFYPYATNASYMADALAKAADTGFYRGIETGLLPVGAAKRVASLVEQHQLRHVQWLTRELLENHITPCAVAKEDRQKAVSYLCELTKKAADNGAHA